MNLKKQLIIFILAIFPIVVSGQVKKGAKVLEGDLSFSSSTNQDFYYYDIYEYKRQGFAIRPKIGWFVSNASVLGIGIGFEYNKLEGSGSLPSISKDNLYSFSPYYRNYQKITDRLFFTTTIDLSLGFGNEKQDEDTKLDIKTFSLVVAPGLNYFVSDKWAMKMNFGSLYYTKRNSKIIEGFGDEEPELENEDFGINFSMDSFSLGVGYYF